jgi:hypothetical protein
VQLRSWREICGESLSRGGVNGSYHSWIMAVADWARGVEYHQVRNTETANVAYPDRRYGRLCLTALIGLFFFSIFGQS